MSQIKCEHTFSALHHGSVRQKTLSQAVNNDEFFGMMEVDIHVPEDLYEHFAEMSPLYVTYKVSFDKIGKHMQDYVNEMNCQKMTVLCWLVE